MHDRQTLMKNLADMGIQSNGTLLVHSSMKAIGTVDGGADAVLDALSGFMADGLLVLPTHTWDHITPDNPYFSVTDSPSCVGILTELFRKRPDVIRSHHPTHSVAALGRDAASFTAGDEYFNTPLNRNGPWGRLLDRRATILFIGADLTKNTYMHAVEEFLDIPNNLKDTQNILYSVKPDGVTTMVPQYGHNGNRSVWFGKMEEGFLKNGAMRKGRFGDAETRICDVLRMTEILSVMLCRNSWLFANDRPVDRTLYPMYDF